MFRDNTSSPASAAHRFGAGPTRRRLSSGAGGDNGATLVNFAGLFAGAGVAAGPPPRHRQRWCSSSGGGGGAGGLPGGRHAKVPSHLDVRGGGGVVVGGIAEAAEADAAEDAAMLLLDAADDAESLLDDDWSDGGGFRTRRRSSSPMILDELDEAAMFMPDEGWPAAATVQSRHRRSGVILMSAANENDAWSTANGGGCEPSDMLRARRRHFSLEDSADTAFHGLDEDSSSSTNSAAADDSAFLAPLNAAGSSSEIDMIKSVLQSSFIPRAGPFAAAADHDYSGEKRRCAAAAAAAVKPLDQMESNRYAAAVATVAAKLSAGLSSGSIDLGLGSVSAPDGLIDLIARHIVQEAGEEPCGLRGCALFLRYEGQSACHPMARIRPAAEPPAATPTFELVLTLRQAPTSWKESLTRRLSLPAAAANRLSTSYKLVKRKLYRSDQDIILKE